LDRPFSPVESAAWGGFLAAFAQLDQALDADLRAHDGLRHVEFEVLLRLWSTSESRMRLQDLAAASLLTRSGTSRLVDRLAKTGLVTREAAPEDGRGSYAVLTDAGRDAFERAAPRHIALVRERFHSRLTDDELRLLGRIWHKVNARQPSRDGEATGSG
jgi:DNA-binding MarR family transcriptional regulator